MQRKLEYSFDDEPVSKFCYDLMNKKIEVHFNGHYDLVRGAYLEAPCIWVLENWEYANSILGTEEKVYDMKKHIGIFTIIFYARYNDNEELEIFVNTIDNKFITIFFREPQLSLRVDDVSASSGVPHFSK